jgi:hypothetical protein
MGGIPADLFTIQGIFPGRNIQVTNALPNEPRAESSIVVDPRNPNRLFGASKRFYDPHTYHFYLGPVFSNDGGETWQDLPFLTPPFPHDCYTDPSTTFHPSGAAWIMGDPGYHAPQPDIVFPCPNDNSDIVTTQMLAFNSAANPNGANWSQPIAIVPVRCLGDDKGWLICDNSTATAFPLRPFTSGRPLSAYHGRLYAIWGASTPFRFARSDDGVNWRGYGNTAAGSDVAPGCYAPDISISRGGTVHVVWHMLRSSDIMYLRSTDGGDSFHGQAGSPSPTAAVTGITDLNTAVDMKILQPGGDFALLPGANFRVMTIVSSCCFGNEGVAIAWAQMVNGHSRVYYSVSQDGGETWSPGAPVFPGLVDDSHQFHPQLAATESGVIGCAAYSYSRTARPGNHPGIDVLVSASFDNASTWSWKAITDQPWDPSINAPWAHGDRNVTFIGEYFGFDAGKTEFHVLWTDTRDNNQNLYYCRVNTIASRDPASVIGKIVATYLSPGLAAGADGWVIVNGHIIHVDPRGPMRELLDVVAALDTVSRISRADTARLRAELYEVAIAILQAAKNEMEQ